MNRYVIRKTDISKAEKISVNTVPWSEYTYKPETYAAVTFNDDAIIIKFETDEKDLRTEMVNDNSAVCEDSCMEFFIQPNINDKRYFNFELNPIGTLHLAIGRSRYDRRCIDFNKSDFDIKSDISNGIWSLTFKIPFDFINKHTGITPICRANFYKCGDKTGHEHYCVWNTVETPTPDFHQSEFFGELKFE